MIYYTEAVYLNRSPEIFHFFVVFEEYEEVIVPVALFAVYNYSADRCRLCGQGKQHLFALKGSYVVLEG